MHIRRRRESTKSRFVNCLAKKTARRRSKSAPASITRRRARAIPADLATCGQCLAEIRDPQAAALSLSVYELHQLRAEVVDHRAIALRPAADLDGRFYDVPGLPGGVRESGRPAFSRPAHRLPKVRAAPGIDRRAGNYIARGEEAITLAAAMVLENCVLAIKGLGGFQLWSMPRAPKRSPGSASASTGLIGRLP